VEVSDHRAVQVADGVYERAGFCQVAIVVADVQFEGYSPSHLSYSIFLIAVDHHDSKLIGSESITSDMKHFRLPFRD
jgi:hypothetical protein